VYKIPEAKTDINPLSANLTLYNQLIKSGSPLLSKIRAGNPCCKCISGFGIN